MDQEKVRQALIEYLDKTGVKATIIAKRLGIPDSIMSLFRHGKRQLYEDSLQKLYEYLLVAKNNCVSIEKSQ